MPYVFGTGSFAQLLSQRIVEGSGPGAFDGYLELGPIQRDIHFELAGSDALDYEKAVFIGVHNPDIPSGSVEKDLRLLGFTHIYNPTQSIRELFGANPRHLSGNNNQFSKYWLTSNLDYLEDKSRIRKIRDWLADEESKELLDALVNFRSSGDSNKLPIPRPVNEQYFDFDLVPKDAFCRFLDAGAYVGDTCESLLVHLGLDSLQQYWGFEPDYENFGVLQSACSKLPVPSNIFPLALGLENQVVNFQSDGKASSSVGQGESKIVQLKGDHFFSKMKSIDAPTFMKFDIEGVELEALKGLEETIVSFRPRLAISVYHKPEDFLEIPEYIDSLGLGYSLHLRSYAYNNFDTVLYAV